MSEVSSVALESMPEPSHPGRQLAAAREACGFTIADIARQLKLSPRQVEAMEADDYEHLPGAVFVRGFTRNYARLVNLDPSVLLGNAKQQSSRISRSPAQSLSSVDIPFPSGGGLRWHRYAIGGLIVLAILVVYEFYSDDAAQTTVNSRLVSAPQSGNDPANVAVPKSANAGGHGEDASLADVGIVAASGATNVVANPDSSGAFANMGQNSAEHQLKLRFERESWVEIRDRHGRKIVSQMNSPGSTLAVSGLPPLSLVVGNAAGVRLTQNDKPVDLAPHIKVDVARLTLE